MASTCSLRFPDYGSSKACPRLSDSAAETISLLCLARNHLTSSALTLGPTWEEAIMLYRVVLLCLVGMFIGACDRDQAETQTTATETPAEPVAADDEEEG